MKYPKEVTPNFAPVYAAALYPDLAEEFVKRGYALAVHGSLATDFDLIAVPWSDNPADPQELIDFIVEHFHADCIGEPALRNHGRVAHTICFGLGCCSLDLSFMPRTNNESQ